MKHLLLNTAALTALALPAVAQQVADCDWQASAQAIVEPCAQNTRTFANGDVRLALLDTIEPAAGAFHILVLSPPYDELGSRHCATIGMSNGIGLGGADLSTLEADYDPSVELIFTMQVRVFDGVDFRPGKLRFTLNQATGRIGASLR